MSISFLSAFIDKPAEVTVVDTDGENFAVLYECQTLWMFRRTSAVILSRTPTLPDDLLARVRKNWDWGEYVARVWTVPRINRE